MKLSYPLQWPSGWKRTALHERQRAKFSSYGLPLDIVNGYRRLVDEMSMLEVESSDLTVTTNLRVRRDGTPMDAREPGEPGVGVYFMLHGKERVLACDKWDRVADNLAAVAAHIDAIRRQERYGVGTMDQAFAGYDALPPPGFERAARPWHEVLGVPPDAPLEDIEQEYKRQAKTAHPDTAGGSAERMSELNAAIAEARHHQRAATRQRGS